MRRGYIWAGIIGAILILTTTATWYIGYANTTHPAPWPMAGGDAGHRFQSKSNLPQQVSVAWSFPLSGFTDYSPPVVGADGTVFAASLDRLVAISPEGKQRWAWTSQTPIASLALGRHDEVYVQTMEGVYAFSVTGEMKWKYPTAAGPNFPMIVGQGGTIYTARQEYLYAITPEGKLKWRFRGGRITSGPVETSRGQILIVLDKNLHALSRDGDDLWRMPLSAAVGFWNISALKDGRILVKDNALYISEPDGTLIADQPVEQSVVTNTAAGDDFLQYGYERFDLDGVRTLTVPAVRGTRNFGTAVDNAGNTLLLSGLFPGGRIINNGTMNAAFGLFLMDSKGNQVWTYQEHPPVSRYFALAGDRIYYYGLIDSKSGSVGLIALGNP